MNYEVEQKFPVADMAAVERRLEELHAEISAPREEVDCYFTHPARDFARTDEALRIRRTGGANFITYKGPKVDQTTKTRREIDLPLPPGGETIDAFSELLDALGFHPLAEVRKLRRKAQIPWQNRQIEGSLDEIERLGQFVELEIIAPAEQMPSAKAAIASLARRLGLSKSERRSYLELLLDRRSGAGA